MKPAICSCVLERRYSLEDAMRAAADVGYSGYEIDVGPSPHYSIFGGETDLARMRDPQRWKGIARAAESAGIKVCSLCLGALHGFGLGDPDRSVRGRGVSLVNEVCRAAADVGVRVVLVPIPQPAGVPAAQSQRLVVESLSECAGTARDLGVVLAVENMPNEIYGPAAEVRRVIDEVGSAACRVYYDVANPEVKGIHAVDEIPLLSDLIEQVHIKDLAMPSPDRISVVNIGEGQVDLGAAIGALGSAAYDGYVVVEVPTEAPDALHAARVNLRRLVELGAVRLS